MIDPRNIRPEQAMREEIVELFDERFFRMWTFYLSGATAAFEFMREAFEAIERGAVTGSRASVLV